ncbi:MAG: helix-turn-helix domain-containing protein [Nitrospira sp.]
MSVPSSVFSILLLTTDSDVQAHFKHALKDAAITIAQDVASLPKHLPKQSFDAVIVESREGQGQEMSLPAHIDPSQTLVITGSRTVLKRASKMIQLMSRQGASHNSKSPDLSLEDYLDQKMGDFVKGMHNGAAKNLHPMLISAVERPLISSALRETRGNQIQAAELLGLNRNTLRKKIADLHIPLKRSRSKSTRAVST